MGVLDHLRRGTAPAARVRDPYHEEFGIPGHVEAVAGHIGVVRQLGSVELQRVPPHTAEMRDLVARGWGVGNHSWSHEVITPATVEREAGPGEGSVGGGDWPARPALLLPGQQPNMAPHVLEAARRYGYLGAMSITDALNRPGEELFWLNRTPLHEQYYEPFYSEYDPSGNLRHAQSAEGWIIDYCHCPLERVVHPNKDLRSVSPPAVRDRPDRGRRQRPVRQPRRGDRLPRHAAAHSDRAASWPGRNAGLPALLEGLPPQVGCRVLTLEAEVPAAWCAMPRVWVDGRARPAEWSDPDGSGSLWRRATGWGIRFQANGGERRGEE